MWYLAWNQDTNHALDLVIHLELRPASFANVVAHGQTIAINVAASVTSMEIGTITVIAHLVMTKWEIRLKIATPVLM